MRTRGALSALIEGRLASPAGRSALIELATRLIVEEALEAEVREALERDHHHEHGGGHRNGHRTHRLKTAEGGLEYAAPQVAGLEPPFRSALRDHLKGHTEARESSRKIARELVEGVVADYERGLPDAVACFQDDFEACIAHLRLPISHRRATRTTNLLERLFVEERRRLKIIPNAFGEKAVLKLMSGAMTRAAERWRSVRITEFERRQMAALRQALDQDYEATIDLDQTAQSLPPPPTFPATSGLDLERQET
jgi:transposase-like protein